MRSSICSLIMSSGFPRIFSLAPTGRFTIFTLWLTLRPFSERKFTVNTIFFFFLEGSIEVSLFLFRIRART